MGKELGKMQFATEKRPDGSVGIYLNPSDLPFEGLRYISSGNGIVEKISNFLKEKKYTEYIV